MAKQLEPAEVEVYAVRERLIFEKRWELGRRFLDWWGRTGGNVHGRTVVQAFESWAGRELPGIVSSNWMLESYELLPQEKAALLFAVTHTEEGRRRIRLRRGRRQDKFLERVRDRPVRPTEDDIARLRNGGDLSHLIPREDDPPEERPDSLTVVQGIAAALGLIGADDQGPDHLVGDMPEADLVVVRPDDYNLSGTVAVDEEGDGGDDETPF